MLRWALIEAIQRVPAHTVTGAVKTAITARRGKEARSIAKVAAARRLRCGEDSYFPAAAHDLVANSLSIASAPVVSTGRSSWR